MEGRATASRSGTRWPSTPKTRGYVRLGDAGTLGFTAPCATLATAEALKSKRDLVKISYALFYLTVDWMNSNPENMKKAIAHYYKNTNDEGIACTPSIAERVMKWYAGPSVTKSIAVMTDASNDSTGHIYQEEAPAGGKGH